MPHGVGAAIVNRAFAKTQMSGGAEICHVHWSRPSARWPSGLPRARAGQPAPGVLMCIAPVPGARSSWPVAPLKFMLIIFFPTISLMLNTS
jgi:hypothetical protein